MVTIHEILTLKNFCNFRLIAGANGLDRKVNRGGFIDHESEEELANSNIKNEMIFSNLPMIKNHPEKIVKIVEALILSKTACFVIKTTLFKEVPKEAIAFANKHNYPIFLFDDIYIDTLILDIDELINHSKNMKKKIEIVEKLEKGGVSPSETRSLAYEVNKTFFDSKYFMVALIKNDEANIENMNIKTTQKILGDRSSVIDMEDNVMVIISSLNKNINRKVILNNLGIKIEEAHIGISNISNNIEMLGQLIGESKIALKYSIFKNEGHKSIEELGLYKLLIPIMDIPATKAYYREIVDKIIEYDEVYQSDLFKTVKEYIKCDGNIKKASELLYQHENTVRYRIKKVKQIINLGDFHGMEYETLALAIHLYKLDESRYI